MIMLLYDMKFRITSLDMIMPSSRRLFFPIYFLVRTQKAEANFQILQLPRLSNFDTSHTRLMMARDPWNLAHSCIKWCEMYVAFNWFLPFNFRIKVILTRKRLNIRRI